MAFTTISGADYGADTAFIGTSSVDTIAIVGLAGSAYLDGDANNDIVNVTNFKEIVSDYTLKGGQGNDSISIFALSLTDSFIAGNAGNDTIFTIDVTSSTLQGGQGNDSIQTADLTTSLVAGNLGNDTLSTGDVQSSSVWGGQGNDSISVSGRFIGSSIEGNLGNDVINILATQFISSTISGGAGSDTISAITTGSAVGVTILGDEGNDFLTGGAGNDVIDGNVDNDTLLGLDGNDSLIGGEGTDSLVGGNGVDNLTGGAEVDTFGFGAGTETYTAATLLAAAGTVDVITDYAYSATAADSDKLAILGVTAPEASTVGGYATWAAALDAATGVSIASGKYEVVAIGSGTAWTSYVFYNTAGGVTTAPTGAIQIGAVGAFGSAASANAQGITLA